MFGLKKWAENANTKRLQKLLMPGEEAILFEQLGPGWIAVTNQQRIFAHEVEKGSVDGTTYAVPIKAVTGLMLYRKKMAMIAGEGFGILVGAKEILIYSGDKDQCERTFLALQEMVFKNA